MHITWTLKLCELHQCHARSYKTWTAPTALIINQNTGAPKHQPVILAVKRSRRASVRTWRASPTHLLRVSVERQTSFIELHVEFSVGEAGGKEPVVDGTVTPCGLTQAGRVNRDRGDLRSEQENRRNTNLTFWGPRNIFFLFLIEHKISHWDSTGSSYANLKKNPNQPMLITGVCFN